MVDVTQAMESSYVNADLVRASTTKKCVILDEGEYIEAEFKGNKYAKFQLTVEIDMKKKIWAPNKDTLKNLSEEWDTNTKTWVGKIVKLSVGKSNGKDTVNGIPFSSAFE